MSRRTDERCPLLTQTTPTVQPSSMDDSVSFVGGTNQAQFTGHGFNGLFFQRFYYLLKMMFPRGRWVTYVLFFMLLSLVILEQFVIYQVGMLASRFYKVFGDKDLPGFRDASLYSLLIIVSIAFIVATRQYVSSILHIIWRENITGKLHNLYFRDIFYYSLNIMDSDIDNPDQRITQDVDKTCQLFSDIIAKLLITPFTMAYYLYKCSITTGYLGPLSVFAFFIVSTVINKFLMSPVARFVFLQERQEGDFRFKHMSIRVNAESAAFFRSGVPEKEKTDIKLHKLISTMQRVALWEYFLNMSISMANYLGSILSYIILAIPIFGGRYDHLTPSDLSALISQNAFVTIYLINVFTSLIAMSVKVADIAGSTHRIMQLVEKIYMMEDTALSDTSSYDGTINPAQSLSNISLEQVRPGYTLENVTYSAPNSSTPLVKDLSLKVVSGVNLLITGDSGCGKSSLLRVIDGLWPVLSGSIEKHVNHGSRGVLILPQKPLLTDGTLREQIIYPSRETSLTVTDEQLIEFLQKADLLQVMDRAGGLDSPLSEAWNWYDMLSPGEMQRLSFVRLLYHSPIFAVLDEATSQIGLNMEQRLYDHCRIQGITVISVGHRDSLRPYHDMELHLEGGGGWSLTDIKHSANL